jgi:ribokinase
MKALTVGGAMVDSIAIIDSARIERMSMRNAESSYLLLEEGRKTEVEEISTHAGGGAVNAAIAMARLGIDVSSIVKLGTDQRADAILARLESEGVSTRWITRDSRLPTGASLLISSHDRNAAVFTFRGANTLLEFGDVKPGALGVDIVYVSSLSNQSADCFPDVVKAAKAKNCLVAANPGVRQLTARGRAFMDAIASIDILLVNRAEANALVPALSAIAGEGGPSLPFDPEDDVPEMLRRGLSSGGFEISLLRFFRVLLDAGAKMIVVTDGRKGAFVGTPKEVAYCAAVPTQVVGTAGAGDAFASTFVALTAMKHPLKQALQAATLNAASVVRHVDTQSGLLRYGALEDELASRGKEAEFRSWPV